MEKMFCTKVRPVREACQLKDTSSAFQLHCDFHDALWQRHVDYDCRSRKEVEDRPTSHAQMDVGFLFGNGLAVATRVLIVACQSLIGKIRRRTRQPKSPTKKHGLSGSGAAPAMWRLTWSLCVLTIVCLGRGGESGVWQDTRPEETMGGGPQPCLD